MTKHMCICGGTSNPQAFSSHFDAWHCESCGSTQFVPNAGSASEFDYSGDNGKYADESYLNGKQLRWAHRTLLAESWAGRRVLEIGCFNGFFLDELKNSGADVYGFDVNVDALRVGAKIFSLSGRMESTLDKALANGPFDDILCIDVLEHLDEPTQLMTALIGHLAVNGRLVVAGPTAERGFHDRSDFPPHHKWWFSRSGLSAFLAHEGYEVQRMVMQRDGMLLLRNIIGRLMSGMGKREFYGEATVIAPDTSRGWMGSAYVAATRVGEWLMRATGRTYCSTVIHAVRVKPP